MTVRKLDECEIKQAVHLAEWTFEYCIKRRGADSAICDLFSQYNNYENIISLFNQGIITIWGVFEKNSMVGVGAMEAPGKITMLYVHPNCHRRGYAGRLLTEMKYYAYEEYKADRISINVIPSWMAGYFVKKRFVPMRRFDARQDLFIPMSAETIKLTRYRKKKIPGKILIGIILGFLAVIIASTLLFEFWYMYL